MYKLTQSQSPYKTIADSYSNLPQKAEYHNNSSDSHQNNTTPPIIRANNRSPAVPIGTKSKEKINKMKRSRQEAEDYFQKELEIKTSQSKKLLQELQQTQKRMLKLQKQCWMMQNQYQSEKRKLAKVQKENSCLNEQKSIFQQKIQQLKNVLQQKEGIDKNYLQNLQNLRSQLSQKQSQIQILKLQNSILSKQKLELKNELDLKKQQEVKNLSKQTFGQSQLIYGLKQTECSKISFGLDSIAKSMNNKILCPPQTSVQGVSSSFKQPLKTRQQNLDLESRLKLNNTHESLYLKKSLQQRSNYYQGINGGCRQPVAYTFRNQNRQPSYQALSNQLKNQLKYNTARGSSTNNRRLSCDYNNPNRPRGNELSYNFQNQQFNERRERRNRMNDSLVKRCKMILHQY